MKCKCGCNGDTSHGSSYIHGHNVRDFTEEQLLNKASCGANNGSYVHGLSKHPLYSVWLNMKQRCYDAKYDKHNRWGGRGITVCRSWRTNFRAFYKWAIANEWVPALTLDREDNDGNYTPSNCRFVTQQINVNNRGMQANNTSEFVGVTYCKNIKHERRWYAYIYIDRKRKHIG